MTPEDPSGATGTNAFRALGLGDAAPAQDLLRGLRVGRFNQRGLVSKAPFTGGVLERAMVDGYEADAAAVAGRWPRSAAFLRSFAASYAQNAEREDLDAELRHDLDW